MLPIFTIGHSTRPIDEFISLLRELGIEIVVDVRTVPRSRTNPPSSCEMRVRRGRKNAAPSVSYSVLIISTGNFNAGTPHQPHK